MSSSWTSSRPAFAGVKAYLKLFLREVILLPGFFCLLLALAACGDSSSSGHVTTSSSATAPPGSDQRPIEAGQLGRGLGPDGLPNLEPPKGVNVSVDTLFAADIKDPIERIKRLENAVIDMRRDYDATLPAIKRLVGIEKDMQTLMAQLETLTNGAPGGPLDSNSNTTLQSVPLAAVESVPMPPNTPPLSATPLPPMASHDNDPVPLVPAVPETRSPVSPKEESKVMPNKTEAIAVAPAQPSVISPQTETVRAQPPPPQPPPTAPPAQLANAPPNLTEKPKPPPVAEKSTPQQSHSVAASGVRLGEDGGKTRLVVDLTGSVSHRIDLDNDEKILVIEFNGAGWTAPATKTLSSPIVQSYTTQPLENGKGTRLIVTLKKPVTIVLDKELPPEATSNNYRLVIDLKGK